MNANDILELYSEILWVVLILVFGGLAVRSVCRTLREMKTLVRWAEPSIYKPSTREADPDPVESIEKSDSGNLL